MNEDSRTKVYDILKDFSTAMFVTFATGSRPKSRPFHVANVDQNTGEIWFLTQRGASLVEEVEEKPEVLLVFQNENTAYLSLRGDARLVQDQARVKELWKEPYKVWFPGGAEDPEIALLAVTLTDAEYWDQRGMNKLEYLFEAAKAYVKGEKPNIVGQDQHAKTTL